MKKCGQLCVKVLGGEDRASAHMYNVVREESREAEDILSGVCHPASCVGVWSCLPQVWPTLLVLKFATLGVIAAPRMTHWASSPQPGAPRSMYTRCRKDIRHCLLGGLFRFFLGSPVPLARRSRIFQIF